MVPRAFQVIVALYIVGFGALPLILQYLLHGASGGATAKDALALAMSLRLLLDVALIFPIIFLAHHRLGVFHPLILGVVAWPLIFTLPTTISNLGGYAGVFLGAPVSAPYFTAIAPLSSSDTWLAVAKSHAVQLLFLFATYAGYAIAHRKDVRPLRIMATADSGSLKRVLVTIVIVNFLAVALFIQLRGGLATHLTNLAFGRFRALEGLGPLLALFDIGYLAMVVWIAVRPSDARSPLFLSLLLVVGAQQFLVAGSRSAVLFSFVLVGLVWSVRVGRVPWKLAAIALPAGLFLLGALNIVRSAGLTGDTEGVLQDTRLTDVFERSSTEYELRQSRSSTVPIIDASMRVTGPLWGYSYVGAVTALVPRAIWREKPRGPGSIYAQRFLGEAREGFAVPVTAHAEAFWNFHLPGVLFFGALYGIALAWLGSLVANVGAAPVGAALYVVLITTFSPSTDNFVQIQQLAVTALLLYLLIALFTRPGRKSLP